jgi:ABC-type multidrug transport system ATPase subunit
MPDYLRKIEVIGIYNRFDITQDFSPGFNILHGVNGSGKTTLIHIITNILNGDYERFLYNECLYPLEVLKKLGVM